jgi:hypothetical protein
MRVINALTHLQELHIVLDGLLVFLYVVKKDTDGIV